MSHVTMAPRAADLAPPQRRTVVWCAVAVALAAPNVATQAAPVGGQVTAGSASIQQSGGNVTINQTTPRAAINWQSFSIGAGETVRFNQPSAASVALNRVLGQDPSQIFGTLSATGQVFLINPNGVLFGNTAQVNVGGIVATTLGLSNTDFLAGRYTFSKGATAGSVVNRGTITAAAGGYVALLAPQVVNEGTIAAQAGTVGLAAGNQVTLKFDEKSLVGLTVDQGAFDALVQNGQLLRADGGTVLMTAKAADSLAAAVVNNTGMIEARTLVNRSGKIKLIAEGDAAAVKLSGSVNASAPNGGDGGFVETSAAQVLIADTARVDTSAAAGRTGAWLIDPSDYTIAASGGNISGAALASNLNSTNVTIATAAAGTGNGDVFVNDAVTWSSANTLTLSAHRDVNVSATIANAAGGSLVLRADNTGSSTGTVAFGAGGSVAITGAGRTSIYYNPSSYAAPNDYSASVAGPFSAWMLVNDVDQLQAINTNVAGSYALGKGIDASATSAWNGGGGFVPLGNPLVTGAFSGAFDGLGHTISNLTIDRPAEHQVGLFSAVADGSSVRNVQMTGGTVRGSFYVGALVGANSGVIENAHANVGVYGVGAAGGLVGLNWISGKITNAGSAGNVVGSTPSYFFGLYDRGVGGLVGNNAGVISNAHATGAVSGEYFVGGLVGAHGHEYASSMSNVSATGAVTGRHQVGGLVGASMYNAGIDQASASGAVHGESYVGGLIGYNFAANVFNASTSGSVTATGSHAGGLIGVNEYYSGVYNASATGNVTGQDYVGGAVGYSGWGTVFNQASAAGNVSGRDNVGGFAGFSTGTAFSPVVSTGTVAGQANVGGLVGNLNFWSAVGTSYATGSVSGTTSVGGLVGYADNAWIGTAYATGNVSATALASNGVGGLVGHAFASTIQNTFATGGATGNHAVGGLVGHNDGSTITTSYSVGKVGGATRNATALGGLLGTNSGSVTSSYWNTQSSGQSTSAGGTGLTTAQMKQSASFIGWDFVNTWGIVDGQSYPHLQTLPIPPAPTTPTSIASCQNGGWQSYSGPDGAFKNQGQCIQFVNAGK